MALGSATHLWILGTPSAEQLRAWILEAVPSAKDDEVLALRLGQRTLLTAINTSDREWWSRSVDLVSRVEPQQLESVFVGVNPDRDEWEVVDRTGKHVDDEQRVLSTVRELVPLELAKLQDYVEWAQELEDLEEGAIVPGLEVALEQLQLGLPPGPLRAIGVPAPPQSEGAPERVLKLAVVLPYLVLGLGGPVLAWWHLLPPVLERIEVASIVVVLLMEGAFMLPFALVWRRFPGWARGVVISVHLGSFIAGVIHARAQS